MQHLSDDGLAAVDLRRPSKNFSALPKRSANSPHSRRPLTSDFLQANPSTGRFGCSHAGFPTAVTIPIQSLTAAISPNGTPVCVIPNGPGFMPRNNTRFGPAANRSR